ncbi:hypothetical protein [Streptomyces sp. NPDC048282]|uniref:hypothetical protein n=1 Tax=Streptomyces sp. NPDC048282 TaxID=3365528 RepID=UPI0037117328
MSAEQRDGGVGPDFEAQVRALLAGEASAVRPSPVPYPEIRRRGVLERRRRLAVGGAALAALAAVPVGAYALGGGSTVTSPAGPGPTAHSSARPTPSASPSGSASAEPAPPASAGQLLDGITFGPAKQGLGQCLATNKANHSAKDPTYIDLGRPADYRIILAMRSTGDSNAPGDGYFVVAVREKPTATRIICDISDGQAGLNISSGDPFGGAKLPVVPDMNSGKLYQQSFIDKGDWKLPFRWGIIGNYRGAVARMTFSYGDSTGEALLDHGWFVATGTLHRQVTEAPHLKGYDKTGKLVYDSGQDASYEKTLP